MPELHLNQPEFTYSTCGSFTKHRQRIEIFREAGNFKHFYRNELNKACFANDAAYSENKDLAKRTISDRACETVRNRGYDGYQRAFASMV